jgi:hypothetical protein
MFTEVWLDNAINKIVHIPKSLVHVLKMKNEISAAKYSKKRRTENNENNRLYYFKYKGLLSLISI